MKPSFKRSGAVSLVVTVLAMLLSVALAVPANADVGKPLPPDPRFKYGMDYYYREIFDASKGNTVDKPPAWKPAQVGSTLNPSKTTALRPLNTSNTPLTGKIIQPGITPAKPPAVYTRYPGLTGAGGALGLSRLLGTAGAGMGALSESPANRSQLALNQGVSQTCVSGGACTPAEIKTQFNIDNCQHTNSCDSIGALAADGSSLMATLRDSIIPFGAELWAWLTGQTSEKAEPSKTHVKVSPKGCLSSVSVEFRAPRDITITNNQISKGARPVSPAQAAGAYDAQCATTSVSAFNPNAALVFSTICQDPATGKMEQSSTIGYGITARPLSSANFNADGTNKIGLCSMGSYVPVKIWFFNTQIQSYYDNAAIQVGLEYSEWINPDPLVDLIDTTKITTTWTCRDSAGATYDMTKTVTKVGGFVEPSCPEGSTLVKHEVTATNAGGAGAVVLDGGNENPAGASQYPACLTHVCALSINLDGQPCTVARAECGTWPQVNATASSRVGCMWGTYTLPTDNCLSLSNAYKTERGVVYDPKASTWIAVDTYGNPVAANPEPWNPTNPNPVPGANPGTTTTTPGGSAAPTQGVNPSEVPGTAGENCLASGWSWNPVSWVMVPVQCALQWAFVPPKARIDAAVQSIQPKLDARGIEPFVQPIVAGVSGLGGAGCAGPAIDLSVVKLPVFYPFSACAAPMSTIASAVNSFFALSLVVQGGMSCIRGVASAFGFNWGLGSKVDD